MMRYFVCLSKSRDQDLDTPGLRGPWTVAIVDGVTRVSEDAAERGTEETRRVVVGPPWDVLTEVEPDKTEKEGQGVGR